MRGLPFADASFASVLSVQSLEHVPDPERAVAEVARVLRARRRGGLRHAQPTDPRPAGRDHRPLPLRRVRCRTSCGGSASGCFEEVERQGAVRLGALHGAVRRGAPQARPAAAGSIRCGCAGWSRARAGSGSMTCMLRRYRHARGPARRGDRRPTTSSSATTGLEEALDVVRSLPLPAAHEDAGRRRRSAAGLPPMAAGRGVDELRLVRAPLLAGRASGSGAGRAVPRCGAATTDPWPSRGGARARLRDLVPARVRPALLADRRRAAQPHPGHARAPPRRDRPAGPGARRRRRVTGRPDRRAAAPRPRGARPRARRPGSPDVRDADASTRSRASGPRSSSGTRSSTCPSPGGRSARPPGCWSPAAWCWSRFPTPTASRPAPSAIAGFTSTCRATSSTSRPQPHCAGLERSGFRGRASLPDPRRRRS